MLISTGMKFRNKNKFRCGVPVYTDPFRALQITKFSCAIGLVGHSVYSWF
jgi:hypothetical protein